MTPRQHWLLSCQAVCFTSGFRSLSLPDHHFHFLPPRVSQVPLLWLHLQWQVQWICMPGPPQGIQLAPPSCPAITGPGLHALSLTHGILTTTPGEECHYHHSRLTDEETEAALALYTGSNMSPMSRAAWASLQSPNLSHSWIHPQINHSCKQLSG